MSTFSFSFGFLDCIYSWSNQHEDQRDVYRRIASNFEAEGKWKINQSYCTNIGQYNHLECPEEERNHWYTQQQISNW